MMNYAFNYGLGFNHDFNKYLNIFLVNKKLVKDSTITRMQNHVNNVRAQRATTQRVLSVLPGYRG